MALPAQVSAMNAAHRANSAKQLAHRKELRREEKSRWRHLQDLQGRALTAPLLMQRPANPPATGYNTA